MSVSVSTAAFVSNGDYIAGVLDNATTSKLYSVNSWTYTSGNPATATPGVPSGMVGFPAVSSVTLVTANDATSDNNEVGYIKLTLSPAAGDVVNASSPMELVLSPNALVVVASTSIG
jgi:hypothetical protein